MKSCIKKILFASILLTGCFHAFCEKNEECLYLSNGIPVYYEENTTNRVDSVYICVKGGVQFFTPEYSGIENAVFKMMLKGSAGYSYDNQKSFCYETRSGFGSSNGVLSSVLFMNCIDDYLLEGLPLLLDGFVNPLFAENEFTKVRNDFENDIQKTLNDPYSIGFDFLIKKVYSEHPYGSFSYPTMESLKNITLENVKKQHKKILDSSRIFIVAVTKHKAEDLIPIFEDFLGNLENKNTEYNTKVPAVKIESKPMALVHQAASETGFIIRAFPAPSITDNDYIPFILAGSIYDKILHEVVRGKYGDCYSAWSDDFGRLSNVGYETFYRCSDITKIKLHAQEARQIMSEGKYIVGTKEDGSFVFADISAGFESFRNAEINKLYTSEVTTSSRGRKKCNSILLWNSPDGIDEQRKQLNTVTCEEVLSAFKKYFLADEEFWIGVSGPEDEEKMQNALK